MNYPAFFAPERSFSVAEIATLAGAELYSSSLAERRIEGIAPSDAAGELDLAFVDAKRREALGSLNCGAVFVTADHAALVSSDVAILIVEHPQSAFAIISRLMFPSAVRPQPPTGETGVSQAAHISSDVVLESGVIIEAGAVLGRSVSIGEDTIISANAVIGAGCQIGRGSYIGAGTTVLNALIGNGVVIHAGTRIGQDGFGYVPGSKGPEKVPQVGRVIIQDNVEIGANVAIDRGAMADTVIGEHTKIDNLVQIAHNVRIGRATIIAGQCGISGSCEIGDGVLMGGGVGLADHIKIGNGAKLAARSGFMNDVPAGEVWGGYPAQPLGDMMREVAAIRRLVKRPKKEGASKGD